MFQFSRILFLGLNFAENFFSIFLAGRPTSTPVKSMLALRVEFMDHWLVDPLGRDSRRSPMSPTCRGHRAKGRSPFLTLRGVFPLCPPLSRGGAKGCAGAKKGNNAVRLLSLPPPPRIYSLLFCLSSFSRLISLSVVLDNVGNPRVTPSPCNPLFFLPPVTRSNVALRCLSPRFVVFVSV